MAQDDRTKGESELRAWNAWKQVCWVHGLGKELQRGRPVIGTSEDERILASKIKAAFKRKLASFGDCFVDKQKTCAIDVDGLDCASEFDGALREYELCETPGFEIMDKRFKAGYHPRKAKAWKDFVWNSVATSQDDPLAVIRGQLLGEKGVINRVVEDWILKEYSASITKNHTTKKDVLVFQLSKDAPVSGKAVESGTEMTNEEALVNAVTPEYALELEDRYPAPVSEQNESLTVTEAWRKALESTFSPTWCCAAFAEFSDIKIYNDEEILEAMQVGHSTAQALISRESGELIASLPDELRDWLLQDVSGTRFFKKWIKERALLENAGRLVLSRIEARDKKLLLEV